jgi:hypothetical protein
MHQAAGKYWIVSDTAPDFVDHLSQWSLEDIFQDIYFKQHPW